MLEILSLLKEIADEISYKKSNTTDLLKLENEESTGETRNQSARRLKILTPDQILRRLLISLARLKTRNNSQKIKNEIRQLLYSLHRLKKVTKQLYKSLVNNI